MFQAIAEPRVGHGTDLNDPLARAAEEDREPPPASVLASDGDWRRRAAAGAGRRSPADAGRCRSSPCPWGSRTRLPDVELLSLDVPTFGVTGKAGAGHSVFDR